MLVVIGLIVGGILVGQSLISAAEVRAQITQIEKYNSAVNTFRSKFNAIPGDMRPEIAQQFGFLVGFACNGQMGQRDGNGLIDGYSNVSNIYLQTAGENNLFWQDLSSSIAGQLIEGQFPNSGAGPEGCGSSVALSGTGISTYFPNAKIGRANFVYVYEASGFNWYAVSAITSIRFSGGLLASSANIPVTQSYNIDSKIDDGSPMTGNVQALYLNNSNSNVQYAPNTTTSGGTSSSCYDTTTSTYSVTYNNGSGGNCALSFRFQ